MSRHNENPLVLSYLTLRQAVGWIGLTLPMLLAVGGFALQGIAHEPHLQIEPSISAYYYTGMGNVFVGLLCAIGVFHLATEGYDTSDRIAGRLACIFAFGVAWFPTTPQLRVDPTQYQNLIGIFHYILAALLFLTLAFFCIFQFTQTADVKTQTVRKKERNAVYYASGSTIVGCILIIGTVKVLQHFEVLTSFRAWLDGWKWNFWMESLALVAFGAAFLTKGEFILKDESGSKYGEIDQMPDSDPGRPIRSSSVPILLHEYDTLRAEIIQASSNLYQIVAIVMAAILAILYWFVANNGHSIALASLLAISAILIVFGFSRFVVRDIRIAASRLKQIEETVDEATGEWYLLRHERLSGGGGKGVVGMARREPVPPKPIALPSGSSGTSLASGPSTPIHTDEILD